MIKRFALFALILTLCGCSFTKDTLTDKMIAYMNEKYMEDEFQFSGVTGGGAGVSSKTIIVSSSNYPDSEIYVRYIPAEDLFTDNYLGIKYESQTASLITSILESVCGSDVFLDYDVSRYACPNKDDNMGFDEYIASPRSAVGFISVVNCFVNDMEQFERQLEDLLVQSGVCCMGTIYFEDDADIIGSLKSEEVSAYIYDKSYSCSFTFYMEDTTGFSEARWE